MSKGKITKAIRVGLVLFVVAMVGAGVWSPKPASALPDHAYWVGGTGDWIDAANHWAAASGGAPGAGNMPNLTTVVHFDANSFAAPGQTVTLDAHGYEVLDMDWTGATNNPTFTGNKDFYIYGSLTLIAGMTYSKTGNTYFVATALGKTVTTAGKTIGHSVKFQGVGGGWTLQDAYTSSGYLELDNGTLNTNGQAVNLTADTFYLTGAAARSLTLGASTLTIAGNWDSTDTTNLTFDAGTSIIILSGNSSQFIGGGLTYNDVRLSGLTPTITGSNTFATLRFLPATIQTVTFTDGTTQTLTTFARSAGVSVITFQGSAAAGWNITKAGGGTVLTDYLSISRSTAAPANTWYAQTHSTNGGNNAGWFFNDQTLVPTTQAATGVTMDKDGVTGGTLNGTLAALVGEHSTTTRFNYGLTVAYGTNTADVVVTTTGAKTAIIPAALTPGQTYHYRFQVANDSGTYNGADETFTFTMPTVTTSAATNIGAHAVTLNGSVGAMGAASDTYVHFEYGPTAAYGSATAQTTVAAPGAVSANLSSLDLGQLYHYRIVATNGAVTTTGADTTVTLSDSAPRNMLGVIIPLIVAFATLLAAIRGMGLNPVGGMTAIILSMLVFVIVQSLLSAVGLR